ARQILTLLQEHGPFSSVDEVKQNLSQKGIADLTHSTLDTLPTARKIVTLLSQKIGQNDARVSELLAMVRNLSSDADVRALCSECLARNNNNPRLALAELKNAFHRAGVGRVSERIATILVQQASSKNVDEIRAFGRKRTVDVIVFLKSLPQTPSGAIDLTK